MERLLERLLFASRWIMAPIFVGLALAMLLLVVKFAQDLMHITVDIAAIDTRRLLIAVLGLIDLALAGSLLMLVLFAGYENFVSRISITHHDRPEWMGKVDYPGMKLKLVTSIVAISSIELLRVMMDVGPHNRNDIVWLVALQLTFGISAVLLAWTERLTETTAGHGKDPHIPKHMKVAEGRVVPPRSPEEARRENAEEDRQAANGSEDDEADRRGRRDEESR